MSRRFLTLTAISVLAAGCGGGGGGGGAAGNTVVLQGRVLDLRTGGPFSPAPTVDVAGSGVTVGEADGYFNYDVPVGATGITVDSKQESVGVWTFAFPALAAETDLGDLWLGPERVTVRGRLVDSVTQEPIGAGRVVFAGRSATVDATGTFSLTQVAFDPANVSVFWGIAGAASATGYFNTEFSTNGFTASGSVVNIGDVALQPTGDANPPDIPYNLYGRVTPAASASGSIVELRKAGALFRTYEVGPAARFYFWAPVGSYTVQAVKNNVAGPAQSLTITQTNQVISKDVALP